MYLYILYIRYIYIKKTTFFKRFLLLFSMWPIRSLDCVKPCSALGYGIEQRRSWTSSPSSLAPFISLSPLDCVPWFIVWWTHSIKSKTFFWTYPIIWLKSQRSSKLLVQEIPKVVGSCPCLGSIFTACSNFFDTPLNIFNFWWQSFEMDDTVQAFAC